MAEPFKNALNAAAVARIAALFPPHWPAFPGTAFEAAATRGLDALELKGRVSHVADALREALPAAWAEAAAILGAGLPPVDPGGKEVGGFVLWPLLTVVERHGAQDPAVSLPLLREMTRRFSAEFAIRPLLDAHPEPTWAAITAWCDDPDPRVRRLCSEGTRSRLPWGLRLRASVLDPSRGLAVIDRLADDPSEYVRRSVANHLGDVAKDHPDRAIEVAARWICESPGRIAVVRHGLRDLLKKGHPDALRILGQGGGDARVEGLRVTPTIAPVGGSVLVEAELRGEGQVRVDVRWEWASARGWSGRTFRGGQRTLQPGEPWAFHHRISLRPVTTRPLRPGAQRVLLRVGGVDHGPVDFTLLPAG